MIKNINTKSYTGSCPTLRQQTPLTLLRSYMFNKLRPSLKIDEIAGQYMVPFGVIETCDKLPNPGPMIKSLGNLPVISGYFEAKKWDVSPGLPGTLYLGVVKLNGTPTLKVCIQLGPNVVFWLANLSDKKVWETLDTWDARGEMAVAVYLDNGTMYAASQPFKVPPELNALRETVDYSTAATFRFILSASAEIQSGGYRERVVNVHPEYPNLRYVQVCMLTTDNTRPVAVAIHN